MGLCDCIGRQESQRQHTAAQTKTILVCLDRDTSEGFHGNLRSSQTEGTIAFRDLGEMMLGLDAICDTIEHIGTEPASGSIELPAIHPGISGIPKQTSRQQELPAIHPGTSILFTIAIEHRDHGSLQGKVRGGLTGGRYLAFQSALDLMRILKSLTEPGQGGPYSVQEGVHSVQKGPYSVQEGLRPAQKDPGPHTPQNETQTGKEGPHHGI